MITLLLFILILLAAFGLGARLLRLLGLFREEKPLKGKPIAPPLTEEFIFAIALGLGVISYLVLLLGLCHGFYPWVFRALLPLLALISAKDIFRLLRGISEGLQKGLKVRNSYASGLLGAWLLLMGTFTLVGALAPAGGSEWDGLAYHLAAPKIYLQHHGIVPLPWMSHSNFPFALEMLYTLGLALQGQILAKLFHFGCGLLLILAVYTWGNAAFGRGLGLIGAALLAATPLFFWEATVAYNELAFALFCFLSIWAWWKRETEGKKSWLIASGLFAGLALATKMLAGFLVIFFLLALIWGKLAKRPEAAKGPGIGAWAGLWLLPAVLVAAPWYIKSYLWTGNPVYPFFYSLFGGKYWSADLAANYTRDQAVFGLGHGLPWLAALPWTLTMYGHRFFDHPEQITNFNTLITVNTPLFLMLLPVMLWRARQETLLRFLLGFTGVAAVIWFFLTQQNRYLLPVLPALALAGAGAFAWLAKSRHWSTRVFQVLLGVELAVALATCIILVYQQLPPVLGLESHETYLNRSYGKNIYPISQQINHRLPKAAKIMLLGETRGFYLDRNYLWGPGNNNLIPPEATKTPEALLSALTELKVTHLLMPQETLAGLNTSNGDLDLSLRRLLQEGQLRVALQDSGGKGYVVLALSRN